MFRQTRSDACVRPPRCTLAAFSAIAMLATAGCVVDYDSGGADGEADLAMSEGIRYPTARLRPCAQQPMIECGTISVPIDYSKPRGARIDVAVVRARATNAAQRRGALFFNPGGPGGSGVEAVTLGLEDFASLREHFDIISMDPRGVGLSQPVECAFTPSPPPRDAGRAAFFDAIGPAFLQSCLARSGELATQVTTANVARDLDAFRAALRERQLTYFAVSYGTILGATYAAMFPSRVRAMVLDSALPPEWFGDFLVGLRNEGAAAAERTLQRLDSLCRGDATCPLRGAGVTATLDKVVGELAASPVTSPDGAVTLDGNAVLNLAVNATFYDEAAGWPTYVAALAGSAAGDHSIFLELLREAKAEQAGQPEGVLASSAFYAVVCSDSGTRRGARDYLPAFRQADLAFPHFSVVNPSSYTSLFTPPLEVAPACAAWPRNPPPQLAAARDRVAPPIVLVGNEYDHSTPWTWTRRLARELGAEASLIHYEGGGHTIVGGSACVDDAVFAYLFDLEAPPPGLSCPANPVSFEAQPLRGRALAASSLRARRHRFFAPAQRP
jgi:pimeloyl-ACP methyl ester carboxylesterase